MMLLCHQNVDQAGSSHRQRVGLLCHPGSALLPIIPSGNLQSHEMTQDIGVFKLSSQPRSFVSKYLWVCTSWPPKYSAPYQASPNFLLLHKLMKHVLGTEGNLNPIGQTAPSVQAGGWSHKVLVTGTIYGLVQKASQQKMLMDFLANFLSTQKPIFDIVKIPSCC